MRSRKTSAITSITALSLGATASAQCRDWTVDVGTPGVEASVQSISGFIEALVEFDEASGVRLFAAGYFESAGGVAAKSVARWDGASWSALGSGVPTAASVLALCAFDDGSGMALYAGDTSSSIGGVPASRIARWNG